MIEEEIDGNEVLDNWLNKNKIYHFECSTTNLTKLVKTIGYDDIDDFLFDNPGAQEAIVDFIQFQLNNIPSWKDKLL